MPICAACMNIYGKMTKPAKNFESLCSLIIPLSVPDTHTTLTSICSHCLEDIRAVVVFPVDYAGKQRLTEWRTSGVEKLLCVIGCQRAYPAITRLTPVEPVEGKISW